MWANRSLLLFACVAATVAIVPTVLVVTLPPPTGPATESCVSQYGGESSVLLPPHRWVPVWGGGVTGGPAPPHNFSWKSVLMSLTLLSNSSRLYSMYLLNETQYTSYSRNFTLENPGGNLTPPFDTSVTPPNSFLWSALLVQSTSATLRMPAQYLDVIAASYSGSNTTIRVGGIVCVPGTVSA